MDIAIQGRNVEVPDSLRDAVNTKLNHLSRFLDGMERAEVHFLEEKNPRISEKEVCEVTMHGHGHIVRARAAAGDSLSAVDLVVDKLEHRMEKLRGKLQSRTHPRHATSPLKEPAMAVLDGSETTPQIVKSKQFFIKPLSPEEATLEMDLLGHDFFLFTNADTGKAAVIYRRDDGNIGLIDAG